MNIRRSRLFKLMLSGVVALWALLGAGSAMAYVGSWVHAAIEGQSFNVNPGDFVRYGRTDTFGCADTTCPGLWSYKGFASAGTALCTNSYWGGDPYFGVKKMCEKLVTLPVGTDTNVRYLATENNTTSLQSIVNSQGWGSQCANAAPCIFYVGLNSNGSGSLAMRPLTSSLVCTNAAMGTDPTPNSLKYCFVARP